MLCVRHVSWYNGFIMEARLRGRHVWAALAGALFAVGALPGAVHAASPDITATGVLAYTNAERYKAGEPLLETNPLLTQIAFMKMQDMFARQYFKHESPTGQTVSDVAAQVGYAYVAVGENLALGDFASSEDVVTAWMNSPGHRRNLLSSTFTQIGIAAGRSMYEGHMAWIVVQEFGLPASSCPAVNSVLKANIDDRLSMLKLLESVLEVRKAQVQARSPHDPDYIARADAYNNAVAVYDTYRDAYRADIAAYNKTVDTHNTCISKLTAGS